MTKRIIFVTTTINYPKFIEGYFESALKYRHDSESIGFIVIGDLKSPQDTHNYCAKKLKEYGFDIQYMGPENQLGWLKEHDLDELGSILPFNSLQRRNIGFLKAYEQNADVIVSLDDDNFAGNEDVVGRFAEIGEVMEVKEVESTNNWFNCCSMLNFDADYTIYPRGFPYSKRYETEEYTFRTLKKEIAVRAGLWLEVPDVNAITHLEKPTRAVSLKEEYKDTPIALARGNYCPFNTQNTGFDAKMLPLLFCVVMGDYIRGIKIDRFDDIWLSFFAQKILHSMDKAVTFGEPLSHHRRNLHNILEDHLSESVGIVFNEKMINMLQKVEITGKKYDECYEELIVGLRRELRNFDDIDTESEAYFNKVFDRMEIWNEACKRLMNNA